MNLKSTILSASIQKGAHALFLDDNKETLKFAKSLLENAEEVDQDRCVNIWSDLATIKLLLFVIDSYVFTGSRFQIPSEEWLRDNGICTDVSINRVVVLYSGEPREGPWHRKYAKSGSPKEDIQAILELYRRTIAGEVSWNDWPHTLNAEEMLFSQTFHTLETLALPIWIDLETLAAGTMQEKEAGRKLLEEIWIEYFQCGQESGGAGYLMPEREFLAGAKGIEAEIARLLAPLKDFKWVNKSSTLKCLSEMGPDIASNVGEHIGLRSIRDDAWQLRGELNKLKDGAMGAREFADNLKNLLFPVCKGITDLVVELRRLRDVTAKEADSQ